MNTAFTNNGFLDVVFMNAAFTNAVFTDAVFADAIFTNAVFTNAAFIDAAFIDVDLTEIAYTNVNFANVANIAFSGAVSLFFRQIFNKQLPHAHKKSITINKTLWIHMEFLSSDCLFGGESLQYSCKKRHKPGNIP